MQAQIIDGKTLAAQVKAEAAAETAALKAKGVTPCLSVILVGEDPASQVYVRGKAKDCGDCGIDSRVIRLPEETTQEIMQDKQGEPNSYKSSDAVNQIDWALKAKNRDIFNYIRTLIALRKKHPAFRIPTEYR